MAGVSRGLPPSRSRAGLHGAGSGGNDDTLLSPEPEQTAYERSLNVVESPNVQHGVPPYLTASPSQLQAASPHFLIDPLEGRLAYRCQADIYSCRGCLAAYVVQRRRNTEILDWQSRAYYSHLPKKSALKPSLSRKEGLGAPGWVAQVVSNENFLL